MGLNLHLSLSDEMRRHVCPLPMWTSSAADDLSVVGSLIRFALRPFMNSSPLYSRLSSGERMMSLTTLFTAGSLILRFEATLTIQSISAVVKLQWYIPAEVTATGSQLIFLASLNSLPYKHGAGQQFYSPSKSLHRNA